MIEYTLSIKMLDTAERTKEEYEAISKELAVLLKPAALKHNIVLCSTKTDVSTLVPKSERAKRTIELMAKLFKAMEGPYEN